MKARLALALVVLAGCPAQSPRLGKPDAEAGWSGSRVRLAFTGWLDDDTIVSCDRRLDDAGNTQGIMGPCRKWGADGVLHTMVSWLNAETPDRRPADGAPPGCRVVLEDAKLVPPTAPARLVLESPGGRQVLDEWAPEPKLEGDVFRIEGTWGDKHFGTVHLAVGVGEGERIVHIVGGKVLPLPSCVAQP